MELRQRLEHIHRHSLFAEASLVIQRLQEAGHVAVFAGGCVRDGLLGAAPHDLDVATSAHPEVVEGLFERTLAVGKAFGTIVVVQGGHNFEVTTFRSEGLYLDGRHPAHVSFTEMIEDARRRDFTVNALFYDPKAEIVFDFVGGLEDLKARRLRAVGNAKERFQEDRLRMLRAVRFVSQLGFSLDNEALLAIQSLFGEFGSVSAERILAEVKRLLVGSHLLKGLEVLLQSQLHKIFWPEISNIQVSALKHFASPLNWENAFAALALLSGVEYEERLKVWKVARESQNRIREQIHGVQVLLNERSSKVQRVKALGGDCYAEILLLADGVLKVRGLPLEQMETWVQDYLAVADKKGGLPAPFLNGDDLKRAGFLPGMRMGEVLKELYDRQLVGEIGSRVEALKSLSAYSRDR